MLQCHLAPIVMLLLSYTPKLALTVTTTLTLILTPTHVIHLTVTVKKKDCYHCVFNPGVDAKMYIA